jgi:hypothetical protein
MNPMRRISFRPEAIRNGFSTSGNVFLFLVVFHGLAVNVTLNAQNYFEETAPGRFRIEFTDKDNSPFSIDAPQGFLSERAILRRENQDIPIGFNDLPVNTDYIDSIRNAGAVVLTVSKWFNSITISVPDGNVLDRIRDFDFVKNTFGLHASGKNIQKHAGDGIQTVSRNETYSYGNSGWQTMIHNGEQLHERGYTGKGMVIAIIDAGFYHVDQLPAFNSLWQNNQILGNRDLVIPGSDVYQGHVHGMVVLSIIGGNLPGELAGTAPDAYFWLLRSEDAGSEFMIEEDNWVSAAEFADSAGADIINTSLGYSEFTDPSMDHTYNDMDGNTSRISRAADMAASRGMLVVVSAGNQGSDPWYYISAPADADSVLAVGAIGAAGIAATFSGHGPSSDLRIKPDVTAIGEGTWMADWEGGTRQGNGTSLSAPVITGLSACLWQTKPSAKAMEVLSVIKQSADRYDHPDNEYGYGIPDFNLASVLLGMNDQGTGAENIIVPFPNPFESELYILFSNSVDASVDVRLTDMAGRIVLEKSISPFPGREFIKLQDGLAALSKGVYLLNVEIQGNSYISKLIRM